MEIYCPRNGPKGIINICQIEGDNDNSYKLESSNIYTEEGFNDLLLTDISPDQGTYLYCGRTGIEYNCELDSGGTSCNDPSPCNDFILPTSEPTISPSTDPTFYPTNNPTTFKPTVSPSIDPTYDPTKDPTNDPTSDPTTPFPTKGPTAGSGQVDNHNTDNSEEEVVQGSGENIGANGSSFKPWIFIVIGCVLVLCCVTLIIISICKRRKSRNKQIAASFGKYASNGNQTQDHHQIGSNSPIEGALPDTTGTRFGIGRVVSASTDVFDDELSQSQKENHGQIYTIPMKKNENFDQNLLNNVVAEHVVMDDIIGHMTTPIGDEDDDDTPTVEMQEINTSGGEHINVVIPNDQEIDAIDNNINYHSNIIIAGNDDDLINDIDEMGATAGNDEDITEGTDDDDVVNEIDDIVTPQEGISMIQQAMTLGADNDGILDENEFVIEDEDGNGNGDNYDPGTPHDDGMDELDDIGTDNDDDDDVIKDVDNFVQTIE